MSVTIQFRRDTAANWTSANPTLAQGEFGYETDTLKYKIGTGSTAWNSLAYSNLRSLDVATTINMENSAIPATPAANRMNIFAKSLAGRMFLRTQGPSGITTPLQPSFFQNNIILIAPGSGTALSTLGNTVTSAGTISHPTLVEAYGNIANIVTAATANATAGTGTASTLFLRGSVPNGASGFFYCARLAFPDASYNQTAATTGTRIFVGLTNQTMALSVGADNPTGHFCGFFRRHVNGAAQDTNWQFATKDGATLSLADTGLAFTAGKLYDFYIFCAPTGNIVYWRVDNVTDNTTAEGSTSNNLPGNTQLMRAGYQLATINAVARNTMIQRIYVETDR
jgi:hypothetical protein